MGLRMRAPSVVVLVAGCSTALRHRFGAPVGATVGENPMSHGDEEAPMDLLTVPVEKPEDANVILGQSHFIKTVDDVFEALAGSSPHLRFGVAFCEASGPRLVRRSGNDDELVEVAVRNALAIGAGHCLVVLLRGGFPVSVLNALKQVPEVCRIYCATANPLEVVLAETAQGRAVLGVVDGESPTGVETAEDVVERKQLLRRLGYRD
jgi:adenosine/AMP kinase